MIPGLVPSLLKNAPAALAPYNPATDANCLFRIDASNPDCYEKDGSNNVTEITDLSGHLGATTTASGAGTFTHQSDSQHSKPMFKAISKEFQFPQNLSYNDVSFYTAWEFVSKTGSTARVVSIWGTSGKNQFISPYWQQSDETVKGFINRVTVGGSGVTLFSNPSLNTTYLNAQVFKATKWHNVRGIGAVNDNVIAAALNDALISDDVLRVGWASFNGVRIGEFIMRDVADDGHTAGRILDYLNAKWRA